MGGEIPRGRLSALTSIFSASVHACWPWPLGKVHRSNSCCMYLMAENKIASKLPSPWSHGMEKEPPGSVFLRASITNLGVTAHHAILRFLTESQTGLPAMCPELFLLRFFVETCWVKKARMTQARPNIILPMSLRLWSLDPAMMFLYV